MSDTAQAKEKLASDFRAVMDDIDALMTATTNKADTEVKALRERIQDRLSGAKEKLLDAQHEAIQRAKDAAPGGHLFQFIAPALVHCILRSWSHQCPRDGQTARAVSTFSATDDAPFLPQ